MIKFLDTIYPDESVYSYLCRLYVHSGYVWHRGFANEVFDRWYETPEYNFINVLNTDFIKALEEFIPYKKLLLEHTLCDIFLVNDKGELLGRPTLTACVDGYSSLCMGYSLGFNKGIQSLIELVKNIVADKQEHCRKFGIEIDIADWNCSCLPHKFITDKGREYTSETFSQIAELGIEIINLPPYRPELKGAVEKFFDIVQSYYKKELANKGVIFEDYQERGGVDYRKKAALTLNKFEKIVLLCIINYNSKRIINLPYDKVGSVQPFANELWNFCLPISKNNLIAVDDELLRLTLLPRGTGCFKRDGLNVNKLRYKNTDYTERYLKGGECVVAYNPENVSKVWLYENSVYTPYAVNERRIMLAEKWEFDEDSGDPYIIYPKLKRPITDSYVFGLRHYGYYYKNVTLEQLDIKWEENKSVRRQNLMQIIFVLQTKGVMLIAPEIYLEVFKKQIESDKNGGPYFGINPDMINDVIKNIYSDKKEVVCEIAILLDVGYKDKGYSLKEVTEYFQKKLLKSKE